MLKYFIKLSYSHGKLSASLSLATFLQTFLQLQAR